MAIEINFRTKNGEITTRNFNKNEGVSIYGKCTGDLGVGEPGTLVQVEIKDPGGNVLLYDNTLTNIWGDYNFYFFTPGIDEKIVLKMVATFSLKGQNNVTLPLAVGNVTPDPVPNPESYGSWLDYIPLIIIAGLGVFVYKNFIK